jgi:hypothetical protein
VSRQAALLLALGAVAAAGALVSFGSWILLRRGRSPRSPDENDERSET